MEQIKEFIYRTLKRSERYTKTDMIYLARGGFWLNAGQVVSALAGLVLAVAFANLVPKEIFGTYKFVLAIAGIVGAFSLSGMGNAIVRSIVHGHEGSLVQGTKTHLKWGFVVVGLSLAGSLYYFLNENILLASSLVIVAIFTPLTLATALYDSFLAGRKDFKASALYSAARAVAHALFILGAILITDNILIIVLVYFLSQSAVLFLLYRHVLVRHKPNSKTDPGTISHAKHLSLMNVMGALSAHIDKVLVFHFVGAVSLAVYAFASTPVLQLQGLAKILRTLALPKLSKRGIAELKSAMPHKLVVTSMASIGLAAVYIILAPLIYSLLFPQYIESVLFSQVLAVTLIFSPAVLIGETLIAHRKTKELYVVRTVIPIVKIALLFLLLPPYGIWGAVLAILISKTLNAIMLLVMFRRI
jgi:O-antigen/teichoic acid export membrane protein